MRKNRDPLKLLGFLLLVYAPFLGFRVARTAGDEKVYVAQALEMERAGTWFLQKFMGAADYFKGPLHYLLVRIGSAVFGHTMWATVWMNLALVLGGSYSLYRMSRRYLPERPRGLALFAGAAFGVSAGLYGFVFASQMEVELACFYAISINLFERSRMRQGRTSSSCRAAEWAFWAVVGLAGWIKSPLYSFLLGLSALLAWALEGELLHKLRSPKTWGPVAAGVGVCALGYLPSLAWDREAFIRTYWLRETFGKGDNGGTWHEAIVAATTTFLFPWTLIALASYAQAAATRKLVVPRLERLCLAWVLPLALFFMTFPYHGESYNLPAVGPILVAVACWASAARGGWVRAQNAMIALTGLLFACVSAGLVALLARLDPRPEWLWAITLPAGAIGAAGTAAFFFQSAWLGRARDWGALALSTGAFFLGLGLCLANVGERELHDLKRGLAGERLVYYDELGRNLWSEWGYLNYMIPVEVEPLFDERALVRALESGRKILVPGVEALQRLRQVAQGHFPFRKLSETPWKRWKLQGRDESGRSPWRRAWESGNLSALERDYFVVSLETARGAADGG